MPRRTVAIAVTAGAAVLALAVGAWAAVATPWAGDLLRTVTAPAAPSPAALLGDETYLAAELEALVVGGSVLGPVTGVDPGDGELGIERVSASLGTEVAPETCRSLLGADAFYPSGYRSRTGPGFESELLLLPSVSDAADRYGDLLRASGRCYRIEERNQDDDLLRTTVTTEVAAGTAPSDDPDGAVHWFAGTRSDEIEGEVAVVTATTGNIVQTFRLAQPVDVPALGRAVAERLAESALLTLQTRPEGALEEGYASGAPVPPSPEPTSRWALARDGVPEDPAPALSPDFFSSAPVPALCEFEAGTLVGGVLPGFTDLEGGVYLGGIGTGDGGLSAIEPSPTTASAAGVAEVGCFHGGVNWPDSLVLYSADGRILDAIGVPEIVPGGYRDQVTDLVAVEDGYRVTWYWEDLDGSRPPRPVTAAIRWDGVRLVVSDVLIGERLA
ncbi:hypothetical protein MT349_10925 [Rathayibacter caricis]|uniref:hypothetical protein n=1 Tax=Rathayibacter caricis TaxID=110936 RepID=UPI001FB560C6|nr:hypothetical protein [Rathayibacter caricis]MCJ1696296.1 hypothetical protein [Rathayibacter caricis]